MYLDQHFFSNPAPRRPVTPPGIYALFFIGATMFIGFTTMFIAAAGA